MAKRIESKSTPQYEREVSYEHGPSEALFPSYGLPTMKENVQNVHLEFSCRHYRRKTSGDPTSFHHI
jgi:hypothetical protein